MRKFEEALFYFPFLIFAVLLKLSFRTKCRECGKSLVFDWTSSRLGICRRCILKDKRNLDGYYARPNVFIYSRVIPKVGDGLILDAGCGEGYIIEKLREGRRHCIGIDLSPKEVKDAIFRCPKASFMVGDVVSLPFRDDVFDWVISVEVLEHVPNFSLAIKEYYRVLNHGGKILLTIPNGKGLTSRDDPGHINFFSYKQFVRLLEEANFDICTREKFGLEFPIVSYISRALSSGMSRCFSLAHPVNFSVPEIIATNFLIVARK
jgi:SAM-dependent methyltransferase